MSPRTDHDEDDNVAIHGVPHRMSVHEHQSSVEFIIFLVIFPVCKYRFDNLLDEFLSVYAAE